MTDSIQDGGEERVLLASGRVWQSFQTDLESDLRKHIRARDIALSEQRARHIRESLLLREQRHALARGPDCTEEIAIFLGWATTSSHALSPINHDDRDREEDLPIHTSSSGRHRLDLHSPKDLDTLAREDGHGQGAVGHDASFSILRDNKIGGTIFGGDKAAEIDTTKEEADKGTKTRFQGRRSNAYPKLDDGRVGEGTCTVSPREGEGSDGRHSNAVIGCTGMIEVIPTINGSADDSVSRTRDVTLQNHSVCTRCLQLQRKLQAVVTDRTLAEAELIALHKVLKPITIQEDDETYNRPTVEAGPSISREFPVYARGRSTFAVRSTERDELEQRDATSSQQQRGFMDASGIKSSATEGKSSSDRKQRDHYHRQCHQQPYLQQRKCYEPTTSQWRVSSSTEPGKSNMDDDGLSALRDELVRLSTMMATLGKKRSLHLFGGLDPEPGRTQREAYEWNSQEGKYQDGETKDLAAAMAAAVKRSAHHFEEQSRRRLLRLGMEADLWSARQKLEALLPPSRGSSPSPNRGASCNNSCCERCIDGERRHMEESDLCARNGDNSDTRAGVKRVPPEGSDSETHCAPKAASQTKMEKDSDAKADPPGVAGKKQVRILSRKSPATMLAGAAQESHDKYPGQDDNGYTDRGQSPSPRNKQRSVAGPSRVIAQGGQDASIRRSPGTTEAQSAVAVGRMMATRGAVGVGVGKGGGTSPRGRGEVASRGGTKRERFGGGKDVYIFGALTGGVQVEETVIMRDDREDEAGSGVTERQDKARAGDDSTVDNPVSETVGDVLGFGCRSVSNADDGLYKDNGSIVTPLTIQDNETSRLEKIARPEARPRTARARRHKVGCADAPTRGNTTNPRLGSPPMELTSPPSVSSSDSRKKAGARHQNAYLRLRQTVRGISAVRSPKHSSSAEKSAEMHERGPSSEHGGGSAGEHQSGKVAQTETTESQGGGGKGVALPGGETDASQSDAVPGGATEGAGRIDIDKEEQHQQQQQQLPGSLGDCSSEHRGKETDGILCDDPDVGAGPDCGPTRRDQRMSKRNHNDVPLPSPPAGDGEHPHVHAKQPQTDANSLTSNLKFTDIGIRAASSGEASGENITLGEEDPMEHRAPKMDSRKGSKNVENRAKGKCRKVSDKEGGGGATGVTRTAQHLVARVPAACKNSVAKVNATKKTAEFSVRTNSCADKSRMGARADTAVAASGARDIGKTGGHGGAGNRSGRAPTPSPAGAGRKSAVTRVVHHANGTLPKESAIPVTRREQRGQTKAGQQRQREGTEEGIRESHLAETTKDSLASGVTDRSSRSRLEEYVEEDRRVIIDERNGATDAEIFNDKSGAMSLEQARKPFSGDSGGNPLGTSGGDFCDGIGENFVENPDDELRRRLGKVLDEECGQTFDGYFGQTPSAAEGQTKGNSAKGGTTCCSTSDDVEGSDRKIHNISRTRTTAGSSSREGIVDEDTGSSSVDGDGGLGLREQLRTEVEWLRSERAELEDTVANINVAAAHLYLIEYSQVKAKCRQLQRVMLGSASKPTEQASRCGQECQELLHSLKMIGLNFFRRRIGGNKALEAAFFPEGLARALTLIGRSTREQGCQTSSKLQSGGDGSAWGTQTKSTGVQVAGGIDEEDESLMEQQVYTLLGKLDLTLRRRENTMSAYRREAEEGAREARALLAAAAAQHQREQGRTGTSEDGSSRARHDLGPLIGGREGPAGAPRPALHPCNLLFTAAAVLDSVLRIHDVPEYGDMNNLLTPRTAAKETAGYRIQAPTTAQAGAGPASESTHKVGGGMSHATDDYRRSYCARGRFSPAEQSLLELADEIVSELETEQRRSGAAAERQRFVTEGSAYGFRQYSAAGSDTSPAPAGTGPALCRPPVGVPPLIWSMAIHLVGKLARAFRTSVEARAFEREVADADLVAAVTLGRSSYRGVDTSVDGVGGLLNLRRDKNGNSLECRTTKALPTGSGAEKRFAGDSDKGAAVARPETMNIHTSELGWVDGNYNRLRSNRTTSASVVGATDVAGGFVRSANNATWTDTIGTSPIISPRVAEAMCQTPREDGLRHPLTYGRYAAQDVRVTSSIGNCPAATGSGKTKGTRQIVLPSKTRQSLDASLSPRQAATTIAVQDGNHRLQPSPVHGGAGTISAEAATVALVEAAAFSSVKPSPLHARKARPASAPAEVRNIRRGGSRSGTGSGRDTSYDDSSAICIPVDAHVGPAASAFGGSYGAPSPERDEQRGRHRPQSARRADDVVAQNFFDFEGKVGPTPEDQRRSNIRTVEDNRATRPSKSETWWVEKRRSGSGSDYKGVIATPTAKNDSPDGRVTSPVRPGQAASSRTATKPRPASAGGFASTDTSRAGRGKEGSEREARLIDTRIWSSAVVRPAVFKCRPRNRIRFEHSACCLPTHAGAVPRFLLAKERALEASRAAERERQAAVNGRLAYRPASATNTGGRATFQVREGDGQRVARQRRRGATAGETGVDGCGVTVSGVIPDYVYPAEASSGCIREDDDDNAVAEHPVTQSVAWGDDSRFQVVEPCGYYIAGDSEGSTTCISIDRASPSLGDDAGRFLEGASSIEDAARLLPDAGELAFFDAWKPKGYDDDLSRH